jgi:hypothetical protein
VLNSPYSAGNGFYVVLVKGEAQAWNKPAPDDNQEEEEEEVEEGAPDKEPVTSSHPTAA